MKRNRNAERRKRWRHNQRTAILLTELETAAEQVLVSRYQFAANQMTEFMEAVRQEYRAFGEIQVSSLWPDKRLEAAAQRFGLCGMKVLQEKFDFEAEQLDGWLAGVVAYGQDNRNSQRTLSGKVHQTL